MTPPPPSQTPASPAAPLVVPAAAPLIDPGQTRADRRSRRTQTSFVMPLVLIASIAVALFLGFYLLDSLVDGHQNHPLAALLQFDLDTIQSAIGAMAQTVAAVLGIVITVVSIVVQLASTRYTPRIAEMFFRDRTSLLVLSFFVVSCIDSVWVSVVSRKDFIPHFSIVFTMALVTASLLLVIPYFAYVFAFLDPDQVVGRIQREATTSATAASKRAIVMRQSDTLGAIEQLSDIAVNAVSQRDKAIASGTVDALRDLIVSYIEKKGRLEEAWFKLSDDLRQNPDFVSLAAESLRDIETSRTWLEWKALRQYQLIYNGALGEMGDINHLVAINTRYIGETALRHGDPQTLKLAIKFFNTYIRATLNRQQVRTAYNVLNQYRQLGEAALEAGQDALVRELGFYLKYYGQTAHSMDLAFVTETAAYDLGTLCERAFLRQSPSHEALLKMLLELDREADTQQQERMLRGVRKAQAKLASFYLQAGQEPLARRIFDDMRNEQPERLASIRNELMAVTSKDFWEVIDRGTNFDFVDDERKARLREFFTWFPSLTAPTSAVG